MVVIRAFQVINQDGSEVVSTTYNEMDDNGNITARNEKASFYAVDEDLASNIKAIESYIQNRLNTK